MPSKKLSNPQKLFNRVARHLLKQRKKSIAPDGESCLYRGPNGLKCGIGPLIKDECFNIEYNTAGMGATGVRNMLIDSGVDVAEQFRIPSKLAKEIGGGSTSVATLLRRLQNVHDTNPVSRWGERLRGLARKFGLDPSAAVE